MKAKHLLLSLLILTGTALFAQIPEFWFLDEVNPGQDISLYPDGANVHDGTFSCKMTLEQPEVPYLISDNFEVNAGDSYTFSIFCFDNDDRGTLRVYADFYDAEGNDIFGEDPIETIDEEDWQEITWSSVVPDGAVHGYILIKFYDDDPYVDEAIAWVDQVTFIVNSENLVLNGSFESWPSVGIGEMAEENVLSVYPNPTSDHLSVTGLSEMDRVVLQNVLGQTVLHAETNAQDQIKLNLNGLDKGMYFVTGYSGNRVVTTHKFIIE
jgi:hypothetical protein